MELQDSLEHRSIEFQGVDAAEFDKSFIKRPSLRSQARYLLLFILVFVFCVYLSSSLPLEWFRFEIGNRSVHIPYLFIFPLSLLSFPLSNIYDARYEIHPENAIQVKGILSLRQEVTTIGFADVLGVSVAQTVLGRFLGYGDINVGTAETAKSELKFADVANPAFYAYQIKLRAEKVRRDRLRGVEQHPRI